MSSSLLSWLALPLAAALTLTTPLAASAQTAPAQKKTTKAPAPRRAAASKSSKTKSPSTAATAAAAKVMPAPQLTDAQRAVLELREQDAQTEEVARAKETGAVREVGGGLMLTTRSMADNLARSTDHTLLTKALRAEPYVKLEGVTILAVSDAALNQNDLVQKMADADKPAPVGQYVIVGEHSLAKVERKERWATQLGTQLTVVRTDKNAWTITDHKGNRASVIAADVVSSDGLFHVIDSPLTAELPPAAQMKGSGKAPEAGQKAAAVTAPTAPTAPTDKPAKRKK